MNNHAHTSESLSLHDKTNCNHRRKNFFVIWSWNDSHMYIENGKHSDEVCVRRFLIIQQTFMWTCIRAYKRHLRQFRYSNVCERNMQNISQAEYSDRNYVWLLWHRCSASLLTFLTPRNSTLLSLLLRVASVKIVVIILYFCKRTAGIWNICLWLDCECCLHFELSAHPLFSGL